MNFGTVLYTAQKNDENSNRSSGWYKTSFAPPRKEQREKKPSVNIQQFLARKEEEERQKKLEAERKKQGLLALRNQDKKSVKRVHSMVNRTKSANKSVLEDAIDLDNTAVTAAGLSQPDEDDYGYTSKTEQELYNKLINKYNSMPSNDSFKKPSKTAKDISTTKDRVKAALLREEEEKLLPRKRKRKPKDSNGDQVLDADESNDGDFVKVDEKPKPEKFKIPKKNTQAPPPLDFQSLLKLAEKKQHEPIIIEKPVENKPERPMTQKEKLELQKERERKLRREVQVTNNNSSEPIMKKAKFSSAVQSKSEVPQSDSTEIGSKLVKKSLSQRGEMVPLDTKKVPSGKTIRHEKPEVQTEKLKSLPAVARSSAEGSGERDKSKLQLISGKKETMLMKRSREQYCAQQQKNAASVEQFSRGEDTKSAKTVKKTSTVSEPRDSKSMDRKTVTLPSNAKRTCSGESSRELPSRATARPNERIRDDAVRPNERSREFPPRDTVRLSKPSREFPPRDTIRQFPPPDVRRKKPVPNPIRRRVIESDDEYDSEIDDFIDDSEDTFDYSEQIKKIFGYDKHSIEYLKRDAEECRESNFHDVQKEEHTSTICGLREDLADIRQTKLEKKLKKKRIRH